VHCGKTADSIRMPFGMVSEVGRGMGVLDGVHVPQGRGGFMGFSPHWIQWHICLAEMYSTRA